MITTTVKSDDLALAESRVAKMLSRFLQFHAFEMEPVIKVRYKLRWLLALLSVAAAAGQPGNPRKVNPNKLSKVHGAFLRVIRDTHISY